MKSPNRYHIIYPKTPDRSSVIDQWSIIIVCSLFEKIVELGSNCKFARQK